MLQWLGSLQIHEFHQTQHRLDTAQEQGPKKSHPPEERRMEESKVEVEDEWNCAVATNDRKDYTMKAEKIVEEAKDKVEEFCQVVMEKEQKF